MTQQPQQQSSKQQQEQEQMLSDLAQLNRDISSDEIAEILHSRYLNDLFYTNISPSILIALNPYQSLTTDNSVKSDYILEYKDISNAKLNQWREPHLYQLVNHAYLHMRRTSMSQSILFR